jgi:sec-independent protein translocase protein TatA
MLGSITDWVVLIVVVLILFGGSKKIPELARGLGRAMGEFRRGQAEIERELRSMGGADNGSKPNTEPVGLTGATADSQKGGNPVDKGSQPTSTVGSNGSNLDKRIAQLEKELEELKEMRRRESGST